MGSTNSYYFIEVSDHTEADKYEMNIRVIDGPMIKAIPVIANGKLEYNSYAINAKRIAIKITHKLFTELEVNMLGIEHSVRWDQVDEFFHIIFSEQSELILKIGITKEGHLWVRLCN